MRVVVEHTMPQPDLITTLAGVATAERIADPLIKALQSHAETRESVRESYLAQLMQDVVHAGSALDALLADNIQRWLHGALGLGAVRKAYQRPIRRAITQNQFDELVTLIRQHYRIAIRGGSAPDWQISPAQMRQWKRLGILRPDVTLSSLIDDAYISGRLAQILNDGASIGDMRAMARELPTTRIHSLAMQAVTDRIAFDLAGGVGYRAEQTIGGMVLGQNAQHVQSIVAAYTAGTLRPTPTNRAGLAPDDVDAVADGGAVQGWRGLGRELRNRMAGVDRNRDWERVAATMSRQAHNIGTIMELAERGAEWLYYDVQPTACGHCKALYLEDDGTPKRFGVAQIAQTVLTTGGANYGRSASRIGDPDHGWIPNAVAHPWCQCRPRMVVEGVDPAARA